jgi:dipeptidase
MKKLFILQLFFLYFFSIQAQDKSDWIAGFPDACTSITIGRNASTDGSVINSHTDDSHRTRSSMFFVPAGDHKKEAVSIMYKRVASDSLPMPSYNFIPIGNIPQVGHTYAFLNTAYPSMNEHQLAIGESTFGGRDELQSDACLIDCQVLCRLLLERCTTARDAIKMAGELTKKYGWRDYGECLTFADTKEVWHFEIVGPGKGKVGSIWVAQRVPDDEVAVNANASRIRKIDLNNPDYFMASDNIYDVAKENNWWNGNKDEFEFCYAYAPDCRKSVASRRREWRVLSLFAPSLKLHPDDENFPFSVKPEKKISLQDVVNVFKDYYEGTPYDMTRNITTTDKNGNTVISPLANPFMPYDQLNISNVSGGWYNVSDNGKIDFLGERTIARWYTMYGTITQSRDWLPDEIGGVVWLAQDNIATSIYIPIYCGANDLADPYEVCGRETGFSYQSAWWAFNRLGTLTAQRWGDMRHDVDNVWIPWQTRLFDAQVDFEKKALELKNKKDLTGYLTDYVIKNGNEVVKKAWELGDFLWTKYDEKF